MNTPINDGGPASPCGRDVTLDQFEPSSGMSLRDYFAAKAMQATCQEVSRYNDFKSCAKEAYKLADAMIEARSES